MTKPIRSSAALVIGIDLDNTLAIYDELLHRLAVERSLIGPSPRMGKKAVRDAVRHLPDGEVEWQKLQGLMYGPRMGEASLSPDVSTFFQLCRENDATIHIVSHKTEFANYDETRTNLRQAALQWMSDNGFFEPDDLGLFEDDVIFVGTRQEKIETIKRLGCTHFVDDLEEVFQEQSFPSQVQKILFAPQPCGSVKTEIIVAGSWEEIAQYIFPEPSASLSASGQSSSQRAISK